MKKKTSVLSTIFSFLIVGALLAVPFFWHPTIATPARSDNQLSFGKTILVGEKAIHVAVASNVIDRSQGLSGTDALPPDEGMLFIFNEETVQTFWMKDMNYPLDIIWIGADKKVAGASENLDPSTYPETFSSNVPVQYVLEVPAGFVKMNKIVTGTVVSF
jgi:uncharacterized membrane protein (UPF0127 family)